MQWRGDEKESEKGWRGGQGWIMKALLCHAKGLGLFVPGNGELFTGCQYNSDMIRGLFQKEYCACRLPATTPGTRLTQDVKESKTWTRKYYDFKIEVSHPKTLLWLRSPKKSMG